MAQYDDHVMCLVAAGIISAGDIDDEYQAYLNGWCPKREDDELLTYVEWQHAYAALEDLNKQMSAFELEIDFSVWTWKDTRAGREWSRLLKEASAFEATLGY